MSKTEATSCTPKDTPKDANFWNFEHCIRLIPIYDRRKVPNKKVRKDDVSSMELLYFPSGYNSAITLGRRDLCKKWWECCPNHCDAYNPDSKRLCRSYCHQLRRKSNLNRLSRNMIIIKPTTLNQRSSCAAKCSVINATSNTTKRENNFLIQTHSECKYPNLVHVDSKLSRVAFGDDPSQPWMDFEIKFMKHRNIVTPPSKESTASDFSTIPRERSQQQWLRAKNQETPLHSIAKKRRRKLRRRIFGDDAEDRIDDYEEKAEYNGFLSMEINENDSVCSSQESYDFAKRRYLKRQKRSKNEASRSKLKQRLDFSAYEKSSESTSKQSVHQNKKLPQKIHHVDTGIAGKAVDGARKDDEHALQEVGTPNLKTASVQPFENQPNRKTRCNGAEHDANVDRTRTLCHDSPSFSSPGDEPKPARANTQNFRTVSNSIHAAENKRHNKRTVASMFQNGVGGNLADIPFTTDSSNSSDDCDFLTKTQPDDVLTPDHGLLTLISNKPNTNLFPESTQEPPTLEPQDLLNHPIANVDTDSMQKCFSSQKEDSQRDLLLKENQSRSVASAGNAILEVNRSTFFGTEDKEHRKCLRIERKLSLFHHADKSKKIYLPYNDTANDHRFDEKKVNSQKLSSTEPRTKESSSDDKKNEDVDLHNRSDYVSMAKCTTESCRSEMLSLPLPQQTMTTESCTQFLEPANASQSLVCEQTCTKPQNTMALLEWVELHKTQERSKVQLGGRGIASSKFRRAIINLINTKNRKKVHDQVFWLPPLIDQDTNIPCASFD